jgi:SAM-dependent methyltransferase
MVAGAGWLLGLNRLRMYVAANISNPLFAPILIFTEIQLGAWLRRGDLHNVTVDAIRNTDPWVFGADLLLGSVVLGISLGVAIVAGTLAAVAHTPNLPAHVDATFAAAADRYFEHSITAWEFARGKLRRDPVYRAIISGALPSGKTLVDIGCGQGLTLAVLADARRGSGDTHWPLPPPQFERMIGVESRRRVAELATRALVADAEIVHAVAPAGLPARISSALMFDVLHLMSHERQLALLDALAMRVEPGGLLLVREADAAGGWRFRAVKLGNRVKNFAVGNWRQTFHFRSADEWQALFAARGWMVERRPMGDGTPFANVLYRLTRLQQIPDAHDEPG